jgi:hypothetical protein
MGCASAASLFCILSAARLTPIFQPSSLGFAPQSCDWFAFIEDDDAAGSILLCLSYSTTSVKKPNGSGEEKFRRWRLQRSPFVVR